MPTVDELINFAINQQPTKFASAFDDIMGEKTTAAIDAMRTDVAAGIYAAEEDDLDVEEHDEEELDDDDVDTNIDDDEFDDVDDLFTLATACFGPTLGQVEQNLRASGYTPEQVDTILMTHLHPDHVCGLVDENGEAVYPNAELRASEGDADFWLDEERSQALPEEERAFFTMAQEAVAPYQEAGRFSPFASGDELLMGIVARDTHGHTPGHASFMLNSGDDAMLVWGDVVHSYGVQFADPSVAIEFESDPEQAVHTREAVLERAVDEKHWVAGAHMPFPGIGHIVEDEEGYRWLPIEFAPIARDSE